MQDSVTSNTESVTFDRTIPTGFPPISKEHPVPGEPSLGSWYTEEEVEALLRVMRRSMDWRVGFHPSPEVPQFEQEFARYCGAEYAFACTSAGTALDMAMMALDLEPGDEVICPVATYPGTQTAVIGQGGTLVLGELNPVTYNLDPEDVERRITKRTRAILVVHDHGLSAPIDELEEVARRHPHPKYGPAKVIGDAARACGAGYKGTKVGKKGWMTLFSFHTQKLLVTLGEGGMVTTDDPEAYERIRALGNWGSEKYWGTNYRMSKLQATVGMVQLRRLDYMIERRRDRAHRLLALLRERVPEIVLPTEPEGYYHTWYLMTCLVPKEFAGAKRDALLKWMPENTGVGLVVGNQPTYRYRGRILHHMGFKDEDYPVSADIGDRMFAPPMHPLLTDADLEHIADSLRAGMDYLARSS
ncbi:MAG: DegT/DnrJ/EryC1/StrS family aminotransferase [Anaerolineae bacterium]|nr:DegT/DnrJ/EryC1/StrS family aminotransferase [Anaerolineae bacterium]